MGPQANAPSCTRRSFLLAALALAVTAPTRARALTTGLGFPEGAAPLDGGAGDAGGAADASAGQRDAADPFADLPAEPAPRLTALCDLLAVQTEAFGQAYVASVQNADASYADAMLSFVGLCEQALAEVASVREALAADGSPAAVNALDAADAAARTLAFYMGYYRSSDPLMEFQAQAAQGAYEDDAALLDALYGAMGGVRANYEALDLPAYMRDVWPLYVAQIDAYQEKIYADYISLVNDDVLMAFSSQQLLARQPYIMWHYEAVMYALMRAQFQNASDTVAADPDAEPRPCLEYDKASEVYPNLYPSDDSVVNLAGYTEGGARDVLVEAQVDGFSQAYRQKVTLAPEISYLTIKPPVASDPGNLASERDTQLTLTVTDLATGELLVQETRSLVLHSVYDFTLESDEFGIVEPYNVLAWMRPDSQEVLEVRRAAIDWLGRNMGAGFDTLPGYQLGYPGEDEAQTTILQAVAIQGAISDLGVRYNMGAYSFGTFQRVLTPDAVVRDRSGICIETALLVASALQSADMHPMILILPGHAQVALETWQGSGQYLLLETTLLPFTGADGQVGDYVTVAAADEWHAYLDRDGVYVIDCDLASELGIRGLAV